MSMTREEIIGEYEQAVFVSGLAAAAGNEEATKSYELFKAGLDALRADWVDAEKQPPTEEGSYLVCTKNGAVTTARYYTAKLGSCGVNRPAEWQGNRDVAYWMPMPEPPVPVQPPAGAVRIAKLGCKRIWVDENNNFVAEVK